MALVRSAAGVYQSGAAADTERLGELMAPCFAEGDVAVLTGGLGVGKTHLTKGVARGLADGHPVTSPHVRPDGGARRRADPPVSL